jgi:Ca2+-binding RTX toxin-like protein
MATFNGTTLNDIVVGSGLADLINGLGGNDELSGGEGHDTLDGGTGTDTLHGGAGNHTYIVDNAKDAIDESGGDADDRIQASIAIDLQLAAYAGIEHVTLTGTGALNATGDDSNNQLIGNGGANKLDGKDSDDTMIGGAGNDTYEVGALDDLAIEYSGGGIDQINSSSHFTLGAYVENLTLTGTADNNGGGNALANKVTGNAGANGLGGGNGNDTLTGNDGNDTLEGDAGADSLVGGKGNDVYVVDETGDKVTESGTAADIDKVESFIGYVLGSNIENLLLRSTGTVDGTGNTLANDIAGGLGDNVLSGLAGNDTLAGGLGDDLLIGGDGADLLRGNRDGDTLLGGAGIDIFEILPVIGAADIVADFNALPGGDRFNLSELLVGVTAATASQFLQTVAGGGGTMLRIDFDGGANSFEDLALLQGVGTDLEGLIGNAAFDGIGALTVTSKVGSAIAETLSGDAAKSTLVQGLAGNDTLSGGTGFDTLDGGSGTDSLTGGAGSDTYVLDSLSDKIVDSGGTDDRIHASITIDLQNVAYDGIEHLTLTGTGAINATGDELANMLIGNAGANKLDGKAGVDTMIGGAGSDTYEVDDELDEIVEYSGEGTDQVNSAIEFYILPGYVENATVIGSIEGDVEGNALANKLTGDATGNALLGAAGNDTLTGNDGDDVLDGGTGADSLVGGKGNDIYVIDDVGDKISDTGASTEIDIVWSTITYTLGASFDRLDLQGTADIDGTGNSLGNDITGNDGDNVLMGLAGDDQLFGGLDGNDLLLGGDGNDILNAGTGAATFVGGAGQDVLVLDSTSKFGTDIFADFNALPGQDRIRFSGILGGGLTAAAAAGHVRGVSIDGNTELQLDTNGGGNSFVAFATLQGVSIDFDGLVANAVLDLLGTEVRTSVTGGTGSDTLAGAATSSYVEGLAGNDSLSGGAGLDTLDGGSGTDTMAGGAGDDTYIVDSAQDAISETGGGNDRIRATVAIDLQNAAYDGIEHVTLTGTGALNATGDELANMLIGNSGANKLDGKAGEDILIGGAGNDTYEVDDTQDEVVEYAGEGTDQVNSIADFFLGDHVENLTLIGTGDTAGQGNALANKVTGNVGDNVIFGFAGNDTLTGNDGGDVLDGGTGVDSMIGGTGNDLYFVDDIGDKVSETSATGGSDSVFSSIAYVLGTNVEHLELVGTAADGTGNSLANILVGNGVDNVLSGLAGNDTINGGNGWDQLLGGDGNDRLEAADGVDTLLGGNGSDIFAFDGGSLDGLDVIADFSGLPGGDVIDLSGLLAAFDPAVNNINNFIRTTIADGNTTIQVDQDGAAGGSAFVDVAVIQGVTTDVLGLLNNGSLILQA